VVIGNGRLGEPVPRQDHGRELHGEGDMLAGPQTNLLRDNSHSLKV
jgi:hypothetical protein